MSGGSCDVDDLVEMYNAQIRFYYKENPDDLNDEEFARRVKELKWLAESGHLKGAKL